MPSVSPVFLLTCKHLGRQEHIVQSVVIILNLQIKEVCEKYNVTPFRGSMSMCYKTFAQTEKHILILHFIKD